MNSKRSYEPAGVLAAFLLGLFLRMVPAGWALTKGDLLFYGYDSFYHMRRIAYTLNDFPHTLWFDSYLNYPHGMEITWPPFFDLFVAGISLLQGAETQQSVEIIGSILPPILGSFTILALYFLAKELFGVQVALLSAFMLAINPTHIGRTHFGWTDHHVLEVLLFVGIVLFLVLALSKQENQHLFAILAGLLMATLAYTWFGAPAYLGFILIYAFLQISLDLREGVSSKETVSLLAISLCVSLLLMLPFWNRTWLKISALSVIIILAAVTFLYILSIIFLSNKIAWPAFPLTVLLAGYGFLTMISMFDQTASIYALFRSGMSYFFGGHLSGMVSEAAPLYMKLDLISISSLNLALALIGLCMLFSHVKNVKNSDLQRCQLVFLVWSLLSLVLVFAQVRFLYLFSTVMAVSASFLFFWAVNIASKNVQFKNRSSKPLMAVLMTVILLIIVAPLAVKAVIVIQERPEISGDWDEALLWLENNTPATSNFENPHQVPEYSIMSWWDYGNWIVYRAHRPVVANNFQAGAKDAARFFLSESEDEALEILNTRRSRYVITDADMLCDKASSIVLWIDEDPSGYVQITGDQNLVTFERSKKFMETVLARCHLFDCSGMEHFRLIYESPSTTGLKFPTNQVKIFERVSGAKIVGTVPYDQSIGVVLNMSTNQGRSFQYFSYCQPNDGHYEMTVPYSTEASYGTHSVGAYLVGPLERASGGVAKVVEVSEEDVLRGNVIEVNF